MTKKHAAWLFLCLLIITNIATAIIHILLFDTLSQVSLQVWSVFYAVFGVVYAILMGFVLAEMLNRFHHIVWDISNELNALQCARDFLKYIDKNIEPKRDIIKSLSAYIDSVIEREWDQLIRPHRSSSSIDTDTSEELYAVIEAVERIECYDQSDVTALDKIITKIADVTTFRTERFDKSSQHLSPTLRVLLLFMSTVIIFAMVLVPVSNIGIHYFMASSMFIAIFLLNVVVEDLNQPYIGLWKIDKTPFEQMREKMTDSRF